MISTVGDLLAPRGLAPGLRGVRPRPTGTAVSRPAVWPPGRAAPASEERLLDLNSKGFVFFLKYFMYLFMRDMERGRDPGRGRSRLPAGNPMRAHEPRVPLPPPQPPPRIQPREEGSRPTTEPPRRPSLFSFLLSVNLPAFRLHLRLFLHLGFVLENRLCPWLPPSQPSERGGVGWASVLVLVRACGLGISGVRLPGLLSPSSS